MSEHTTLPVVVINGWGFESAVLDEFASQLQSAMPDGTHHVISPLPNKPLPIDSWLTQLYERYIAPASAPVWCVGWSLGGQVAALLAARYPDKVGGLITLCSNPRFTQTPEWRCAMPVATFEAFAAGFEADAPLTRQRFAALCAQGSLSAKALLRQLRPHLAHQQEEACASLGLLWLASLDTRKALQTLTCPQLHLFAEKDALVPSQTTYAVRQWMRSSMVECLPNVGHALPIEAPSDSAARVRAFITQHVSAHGASTIT